MTIKNIELQVGNALATFSVEVDAYGKFTLVDGQMDDASDGYRIKALESLDAENQVNRFMRARHFEFVTSGDIFRGALNESQSLINRLRMKGFVVDNDRGDVIISENGQNAIRRWAY